MKLANPLLDMIAPAEEIRIAMKGRQKEYITFLMGKIKKASEDDDKGFVVITDTPYATWRRQPCDIGDEIMNLFREKGYHFESWTDDERAPSEYGILIRW